MSHDDDQVLETEYEVERIVGHDVVWVLKEVGTMSKRRKLAPNQVVYRVRWVGYGPDDDTWEPAGHFDGTDFLEDYCPQHGLYGQDRLTCVGRMHKESADGSKHVKKKSITRDPPPKKAKTKRVSVEESDDDLTRPNLPSTSGEGVKKKKEKKDRADREKSSTPSKKASVTKRASIDSDSDDNHSTRDETRERPSISKLDRENSADSLHTSRTSSSTKPKLIAPGAAKHADGSSVKKSSSLSSHKALHGSEKKKSIDETHRSKDAKKRKHENDGKDPERKKKPKLHDGKEVHSPHTAKSLESGNLTKTTKSTLTVQNPHTSGDAFMAAFQPKLEKRKENAHRPKPFTVPAPTHMDTSKPAVSSHRVESDKGAGPAHVAHRAPTAVPVEKHKRTEPADVKRPQQTVSPFNIANIQFEERPGTSAQHVLPVSAGRRPSLVTIPEIPERSASKYCVFFRLSEKAVMTVVSTRDFDFEQGLEYVSRVAESTEYPEGEQGDEYTPIVFKRCEADGDPQCPIPRLIAEEEKKLGTDWPQVGPLRPRALSAMRSVDYDKCRNNFTSKPTIVSKKRTIEEFRQFSTDANGNLLWNRMKRAVLQCDLGAVANVVETLYLPRRLPLSRECAFGRCLVQWASGEGRPVIVEMFATAAASPTLCAEGHQRCRFMRNLWLSLVPDARKDFVRVLERSTNEPFAVHCVKSSAKCQLDLAVEIGVSLEQASPDGESALTYLLRNSLMDVVVSLLERGLDCRVALEQCAQLKDASNWPSDWMRETMQRYLKMLRVFFGKWTLQDGVGFKACYPIEPISFVRVTRMPAFESATHTFKIKLAFRDGYTHHNIAQKVLAIYSVKLKRPVHARTDITDPRRVIGEPTVHSMQCPPGPSFLHISPVKIIRLSEDGAGETAEELSFVSGHTGRLWIYAIPPEALAGKKEVTVSTTLHARAVHEPGVLLFSQIWDASVLGPFHSTFEKF